MKYCFVAALAMCAAMLATHVSAQNYGPPNCHARQLAGTGDLQGARECRRQKNAWRRSMGYGRGRFRNPDYANNNSANNTNSDPAPAPAPAAGATDQLTRDMDRIVNYDAQSWFMNRYIAGSITNVRYSELSDGRSMVSANYNYMNPTTNSAVGWVRLYLSDGQIDCITYHDYPDRCRAVGDAPALRETVLDFARVVAMAYMPD